MTSNILGRHSGQFTPADYQTTGLLVPDERPARELAKGSALLRQIPKPFRAYVQYTGDDRQQPRQPQEMHQPVSQRQPQEMHQPMSQRQPQEMHQPMSQIQEVNVPSNLNMSTMMNHESMQTSATSDLNPLTPAPATDPHAEDLERLKSLGVDVENLTMQLSQHSQDQESRYQLTHDVVEQALEPLMTKPSKVELSEVFQSAHAHLNAVGESHDLCAVEPLQIPVTAKVEYGASNPKIEKDLIGTTMMMAKCMSVREECQKKGEAVINKIQEHETQMLEIARKIAELKNEYNMIEAKGDAALKKTAELHTEIEETLGAYLQSFGLMQ